MISSVRGEVTHLGITDAVVEVGGVGLRLACTPETLAGLRLGQQARLAASLVVREDSMTLFGFVDDDERSVFELVQTASGVGPKLAQAMLAVLRPDDVRRAVSTEDVKALTTVPGIGQKGAQRIILELKDRIGAPTAAALPGRAPVAPSAAGWQPQVHEALTGLGWSAKEADKAVERVAEDPAQTELVDAADVAGLLRAALRGLSKA
ncbi:Holliday junction branch migration protein RuvA [Nocardioidaceae bacterium]|nr:Holliday junction branch migration protein RuvA [Nocardioidaceae bacterium]